jgi:hypothetical protein
MDESDRQLENAEKAIRERREPGSNATAESDRHPAKDEFATASTYEGMQIE